MKTIIGQVFVILCLPFVFIGILYTLMKVGFMVGVEYVHDFTNWLRR